MSYSYHSLKKRSLVAAGASLSLLAAVAVPSSAIATESEARGLFAPESSATTGPMNYAINLSEDASEADMAAFTGKAEELGGVLLSQYPQIDSFFVQANDPGFAEELATAATELGMSFDSIGPTRQATVTGEELLVEEPQPALARSFALESDNAVSQLDKESELEEFTPDPSTQRAWGVSAVGALAAQEIDVMLDPVTVAVLDTGIDGTHPDLAQQIDAKKSVGCDVNGIADTSWNAWQDNHYHGTHVAGTVAAAHNGVGVDGVAPDATLAAVRTGNTDGFFYPEYVTCAFVWVAEHDIDITNNSYYVDPWAFWVPSDATQAAGYEVVRRAVAYSDDNNVLNVGAAGNSNYDMDNKTTDDESPNDVDTPIIGRDVSSGFDLPGELPGFVSVSSVARPSGADPLTATLSRSSFSNYGVEAITVAAPGSSIYSTVPVSMGGYGSLSGTSMASPHTAGVAALLKAVHPNATAEQLTELLEKQAGYTMERLAVPTDGKEYRGAGLANAFAAVTKDQPQPTIATIEYSIDNGKTWAALQDAKISGKALLRVNISGPATKVTLDAGEYGLNSVEGTGKFDQTLSASIPVDFNALTSDKKVSVSVLADGRNAYSEADDDVQTTISFIAAAPVVEPVPSASAPTQSESTKQSSQPAASESAKAGKQKLAKTGSNATMLFLFASALIAAGGVMAVASKSRR